LGNAEIKEILYCNTHFHPAFGTYLVHYSPARYNTSIGVRVAHEVTCGVHLEVHATTAPGDTPKQF